MTGFFTSEQVKSKSRPDGKIRSCVSCGLFKGCHNPRMEPWGNFNKKILNIGEAPTEIDDIKNKLWQNKAGRELAAAYKKLGIDLFEDCLNISACHCRPVDESGKDRFPTPDEVSNCRKRTFQIIDQYKPKVIVLFGNSAIYSVIGNRWKKDLGGVEKWRGWAIPDQELKAWIFPLSNPSFFVWQNHEIEETIWTVDLQKIPELLKSPMPKYIEPKIDFITDLSPLYDIKEQAAFDFETTGLKPHHQDHKIVCASVADSENHAFAFMIPKSQEKLQPFLNLLTNKNIRKIAHNMKYEDTWTAVKFGIKVKNWGIDTMQAAHILDNRSGISGLKFQTYINFGIIDYASEISPYLEADEKNGNAFNKIFELIKLPGGKEKLLTYCGLDSVYEYRLAELQKPYIFPNTNDECPF